MTSPSSRYTEWLAEQAKDPAFDGYYTEPRARFACADDDVLQVPGDVRSHAASCGVHLASERARVSFDVCGVRIKDVERLLGAINGVRTAREIRAASAVTAETWTTFMNAAFGTVVFAPMAVAELEARAPSSELVRFPGSPYEVVRPYWANQIDVRARIHDGLQDALKDGETFLTFVRELHVLALTGASGTSFYRPASPVAAKERFEPGTLATAPVVTESTKDGLRFVSGLRVSASALGGPFYRELLVQSVTASDLPSDVPWGAVLTARADSDPAPAPWFCPPRPMLPEHFDVLAQRLSAALSGDAETALSHVAAFHHGFVRLHPFGFANQCLAMALANHVVAKVQGAGIPHLILDHLALDLPLSVYAVVFQRAVSAWLPEGENAVQRALGFVGKKSRCFEFMRALAGAQSIEAVRGLVEGRAGDARLAML